MPAIIGSGLRLDTLAALSLGLVACSNAGEKCEVLRSWTVEAPALANAGFNVRAWRAPGGFVMGTTGGDPFPGVGFAWRTEAGDAAQTEVHTGALASQNALYSIPIGQDLANAGALLVRSDSSPAGGYSASLTSEVWRGEPSTAGASHALGAAFVRGTTQLDGAPSLDGQRALFATGHVVEDAPHAFLMDAEGAPVGGVIAFAGVEGTSPLFHCLTVIPTAHAAALSLLLETSAGRVWSFKEISADGAVVQQVTWRLPSEVASGLCPTVQLTRTGFAAIFVGEAGQIQTLTLVNGKVSEILPALSIEDHGTPLWLAESKAGGLLWLVRTPGGGLQIARVADDSTWRSVDADLGQLSVLVSSEAGRLFLTPLAAEESGAREISEIGCSGDELAF